MSDTWGVIGMVVVCVLVVAVIFIVPAVLQTKGERDAACVQGGYGGSVWFARQNLCLGVNQDAEWKVEPLDVVRERLEAQ